ncbi:MAG: glycine betaine ABC transporter substrate-binding protein [Spirochaetota bacterium]
MRNAIRTIALVLLVGVVSAALFIGCGQKETQTANLTYVNWEEGVAYTHLAQVVLEEEMDYDVTITAADVGPAYASVAGGDQDAFMEAWLPTLHASYMDEYGDDLVDLGVVFQGTQNGLVVPTYMIDDGVTTVSDLADPEVVDQLDGRITGIDAGAGIMITTEEDVMPAYGLDEAGLELVPSSGPAMMAALESAVENEEYIVVTGWEPHSMFGYFDLAFLEQDEEQVWSTGNIHLIGRRNLEDDKPELAQFLSNMELTNPEIGSLMVAIRESNLDTLEAAREWKQENENVWSDWIPES